MVTRMWVEHKSTPEDTWHRDPHAVPTADQNDVVASISKANERLGWTKYRVTTHTN